MLMLCDDRDVKLGHLYPMERTREKTKIEYGFEEMYIRLVWTELQTRFGFNVPEWKKRYFAEWNKNRSGNEAGFFLSYMNRNVNPLLNRILCRHEGHPTLNKLVEYVVNRKS